MKKIIMLPIVAALVFPTSLFAVAPNPGSDAPGRIVAQSHIPVCPRTHGNDEIQCNSRVIADKGGKPVVNTLPSGLSPAQIKGAYALNGITSGKVIAIVDAYDHPNIKSDLDNYNKTFGLPAFPSCTTSAQTGCFQKVDQRGGGSYPALSTSWSLEIAMDVEVAHAVCQDCKIILVEADSNSYDNLMAAIDTAVRLGANSISNSWSSPEFLGETAYDSHLNKPGIAIAFSSGDAGYGTQYPAASQYVTAVGGTTLNMSGNSYVSETAWSGAGSGCSQYEPQPAFQSALGLSDCTGRIVADVSSVADPNTGAAVYNSCNQYDARRGCKGGWYKVGGTSLATPIVAAVYALAGDLGSSTSANSLPYVKAGNLRDIASGSNGSCGGSYLCTALPGFDGPTGLGTPNGWLAF